MSPSISLSSLAERLVLSPSLLMSLYCYSILRLDPYIGCSFNCKYCFVKSLPGAGGAPRPLLNYPQLLERVLSELSGTPLRSMPYRLSALTDPLQPLERNVRHTLHVLELATRENLKILLSTKSALAAEEPWLGQVLRLADSHSITVQVTLVTLSERLSRCLEPGAPPPEERLKAVERLASNGVPVVVRLQPLIPYINDQEESLEELVSSTAAAGARQIIAEYYRFLSKRELLEIASCAEDWNLRSRLFDKHLWERLPSGSQKRPRHGYRIAKYAFLRNMADRNNMLFSICREGLYELWSAPDCCGIHFMRGYRLKPTLREVTNGEYARTHLYIREEELSSIPYTALRRKLLRHYELLRTWRKEPRNYIRKICCKADNIKKHSS